LAESILHQYHRYLPDGITLIPGSGGVFDVTLGDRLIYSKKETGRFPQPREVEKLLADFLGE